MLSEGSAQRKVSEFCPQMDIQSYNKYRVLKKGSALAPRHAAIVGLMLYLHYLSTALLPPLHADTETK